MRLTKKHIRQMILREMKELNEQAGWSREAAYVPPPEQQTSMRDQMVQEIMAITVPGIPGAIYSQVEAEAMADAKIAALNAPMAGAGESTSYGAPRAGRIVREMRMAPTHAGAIEMMQANPDETVMFEPGEEVPPADAIADAVEGIQDQGLLTKIWSMIKSATKPINPEDAFEYARQQRENPTGINKWLGGGAADAVLDDLGTLSEGFEPGGYRAEGDRKVSEVSVGVSRWNILAGTEK